MRTNPKAIFITATDTGVGKTIVAATVAMLMRKRGIRVGVMKPVTSGCRVMDGKPVSEDAELLTWAAGSPADADDYAPYLLHAPLAPSVAATMEGVSIDFQRIQTKFHKLSADHDFVIVEGAGGLMVPLAGGLLIADLILHLGIPALVVSRPGLGTINHTLLTTYSARQLGIVVKGIVINDYPEHPDQAEKYAPHLISSLSGAPVLGVFPHIASSPDTRDIVSHLVEGLSREKTTAIMLREIGIE
jgi:dethiobiotin synthetase